jgi:hypothetical protein
MLAFYYQMLKLDKPHASTKYIVLWISSASTQCTYGAAVKLFCRFLLVGDCHIHPATVGNVDVWRKLLQASAGGVLWATTSSLHHISLFIRCDLTLNLGKTC